MSKDAALAAVLDTARAGRRPWISFIPVCASTLIIVLDATVVTVALPSIREDLKLTDASLVWVVNAYTLTYGATLLVSGRLGDLYGPRRLFLTGVACFTAASAACGLMTTGALLFVARAVQGFAGAIVVAVALSLIIRMFPDTYERTRAISVYGFICACGGSAGLLLGGVIASAFNWHWIFLINLPVGLIAYAMCLSMLPEDRIGSNESRLDLAGAITVTVALALAMCAANMASKVGWMSAETVATVAGAAASLIAFLIIEARSSTPLMPLGIFRRKYLAAANIVSVLWAAGGSAWFFTSALYMQLVLGYDPVQVAVAFVPATVLSALFGLSFSARLVRRFGLQKPVFVGLLLGTVGLALFARAPVDGNMLWNIIPSMILLGMGGGIAFNPLLLAALNDVGEAEAGLASGIVNTTSMLGGALGLAVFASLSTAHANKLVSIGVPTRVALVDGYHLIFFLGAIGVGAAAILSLVLLPAAKSWAAKANRR